LDLLQGHGICYGPRWYWSGGRSRLSILYFGSILLSQYTSSIHSTLGIALILVITTTAIGYGIGLVAGVLWNGIHSRYRVRE
jgi:hypothetical protein